jgi:predicted acyl esterase
MDKRETPPIRTGKQTVTMRDGTRPMPIPLYGRESATAGGMHFIRQPRRARCVKFEPSSVDEYSRTAVWVEDAIASS